MNKKDKEKFASLFKSEISDFSESIDPNNELEWRSMTIGWAIAKGISINDALAFANYIRYKTELG